jgi:hypothetical protein
LIEKINYIKQLIIFSLSKTFLKEVVTGAPVSETNGATILCFCAKQFILWKMLTVLVLSREHLLYGEKVYLFTCIKKYFKIHILLHQGYKQISLWLCLI